MYLDRAKPTTTQFSPAAIRPFPKAGKRKIRGRPKKVWINAIVTDTPVKRAIEEEEKSRKKGEPTRTALKVKPMAKRKILSSRYVVNEVLLSCEIFL